MLSRRGFLFGMLTLVIPKESRAQDQTIRILPEDRPRFDHLEALRPLLRQEQLDMDINRNLGMDAGLIRKEDRLYAKIQSERKW